MSRALAIWTVEGVEWAITAGQTSDELLGMRSVVRSARVLIADSIPAYAPFAAGFIGIGLAYIMYVAQPSLAESFKKSMGGLYTLVYNKYFVDEAYNLTVVEPLIQGSRTVLWQGIDAGLIDGTVNGIGARSRGLGHMLRLLQSGSIRNYAAWVAFGSVLLLIAVGFAGGAR